MKRNNIDEIEQTGVLYNKSSGDYWCGQFGWMPLPNSRVSKLSQAEASILINNEVCLGASEADFVFCIH